MTRPGLVVGVDIGATKIRATLQERDGAVLTSDQTATPHAHGLAVVDAVVELAHKVGAGQAAACGVATAGVVDCETGVVIASTESIPGWAGTNIRGLVSTRLGLPVVVDNDGNALVYGEVRHGAAKGATSALAVAVGTGLGGGILIDDAIWRGAHWGAGEIGHVRVPEAGEASCPCGGFGHAESVASAKGMTRTYRRESDLPDATFHDLTLADEMGDPVASRTLRDGGAILGRLIGGMLHLIDPEVVILAGGVTMVDTYWHGVLSAVAAEALPRVRDTPVRRSALGADAVAIGAGALARAQLFGGETR